jgi:hypothetical protein
MASYSYKPLRDGNALGDPTAFCNNICFFLQREAQAPPVISPNRIIPPQPSCSTLSASSWAHWPCSHQVTARHTRSQPHPRISHGSPPLTIPRSKAVAQTAQPPSRSNVAELPWLSMCGGDGRSLMLQSICQCFHVTCQDGSSKVLFVCNKHDFCVQHLERWISAEVLTSSLEHRLFYFSQHASRAPGWFHSGDRPKAFSRDGKGRQSPAKFLTNRPFLSG